MSVSLTGLLIGAGASYEIGLPLVGELTTELKAWLSPAKLRALNTGWRAQGGGYTDAVIEDVARMLALPNLHYESILGYLETQYRRQYKFQQEYHGLYSWLVEMVYHILCLRHTQRIIYRMASSLLRRRGTSRRAEQTSLDILAQPRRNN